MAGLGNDSWAHMEKNEKDGRALLRMAGGWGQTMSDVVILNNLHNKRDACEETTKVKQIIKCSRYQDKTESIILLRVLFSL